jgi:hypothetical protein
MGHTYGKMAFRLAGEYKTPAHREMHKIVDAAWGQ